MFVICMKLFWILFGEVGVVFEVGLALYFCCFFMCIRKVMLVVVKRRLKIRVRTFFGGDKRLF